MYLKTFQISVHALRQMQGKDTALSEPTFDGDATFVRLDNVLDDGQPQSGSAEFSATGLIDAVEAFKQTGEVLLGDAAAAVTNVYEQFGLIAAGFDPDFGAGVAVLDGIVHEIDDGLFEQGRIDASPEVFGAVDLDTNVLFDSTDLAQLGRCF